MRIGISPGYLYLGSTVAEELAFALEAERLGFDSFWVGEPYGCDASAAIASFATATASITLGSGVLAMPGRTPAMTAQAAATLDLISGGRFILGLGSSGPQVAEGWHGVPFTQQLDRTRDYLEIIRMVLRGEHVRYEGKAVTLPLREGDGKPLKLIITPHRSSVPIYLAALGPRNVELCGEIADGWLPMWYAPERAPELRAPLITGAERARRDPAAIETAPLVVTCIDEDLAAARDATRPMIALYVGGMGSRRRNFYKNLVASYGFAEAAETIQELYLSGQKAEAAASVPDALIDMVCLCGPEDRIAERLADYRAAGVDHLIAVFTAVGGEAKMKQLSRFAHATRQVREVAPV